MDAGSLNLDDLLFLSESDATVYAVAAYGISEVTVSHECPDGTVLTETLRHGDEVETLAERIARLGAMKSNAMCDYLDRRLSLRFRGRRWSELQRLAREIDTLEELR